MINSLNIAYLHYFHALLSYFKLLSFGISRLASCLLHYTKRINSCSKTWEALLYYWSTVRASHAAWRMAEQHAGTALAARGLVLPNDKGWFSSFAHSVPCDHEVSM